MKRLTGHVLVLAVAFSIAGSGCSPRQKLLNLADDLDQVARHIEEWGTVSISGPFISTPSEADSFKLQLTDKELFEGARTEGAASEALVRALAVKLAAEASLSSGSGTATTAPSLPQDSNALQAIATLTPPLSVYSDDLAMSQRRRIRLAASDRAEINMHKFFSYPAEDRLALGQRAYFLNFTVTCAPGWRTRKGYSANLDVRVEYTLGTEPLAEILREAGSLHPLVGAVYPAFDSQELNLRSSYRQMVQVAGQLAAANQVAGAKAFLEAAERYEKSAETATGLAQATSYSQGGRNFGYEFRPCFRAIGDLGQSRRSGAPGLRLESLTFPAVAVVLVHDSDVKATLGRNYADVVLRTTKVVSLVERVRAFMEATRESQFKSMEDRCKAIETRIESMRKDLMEPDKSKVGQEQTSGTGERQAIQARLEKEQKQLEGERMEALRKLNETKEMFQSIVELLDTVRSTDQATEAHREAANRLAALTGDARVVMLEGLDSMLSLTFEVTHTWRPVDPPAFDRWPLLEPIGRAFQRRRGYREYVDQTLRLYDSAARVARLRGEIEEAGSPDETFSVESAREALVRRWNMLQAQLNNISPFVPFPVRKPAKPDVKMEVTNVLPSVGYMGQENTFLLVGRNLPKKPGDDGVSIMIEGIERELKTQASAFASGALLAVTVPKDLINAPKAGLVFVVKDGTAKDSSPVFQYVDRNATAVIEKVAEDNKPPSKTILTAPESHLEQLIKTQQPAPKTETKPASTAASPQDPEVRR